MSIDPSLAAGRAATSAVPREDICHNTNAQRAIEEEDEEEELITTTQK